MSDENSTESSNRSSREEDTIVDEAMTLFRCQFLGHFLLSNDQILLSSSSSGSCFGFFAVCSVSLALKLLQLAACTSLSVSDLLVSFSFSFFLILKEHWVSWAQTQRTEQLTKLSQARSKPVTIRICPHGFQSRRTNLLKPTNGFQISTQTAKITRVHPLGLRTCAPYLHVCLCHSFSFSLLIIDLT